MKTVDDGMILTDPAVTPFPPAEWLPRAVAASRRRTFVLPLGTAETVVQARVDAGRWIVDCPGCPSHQWVTWTDPRFLCTECENVRVSGRWLPVEFPPDDVREECERVLEVRPPANQFWTPETEDVVTLMGENVTMNLPPFAGY